MLQSHTENKALNLCVFCGSRSGTDPDFKRFATNLGEMMASAGVGLVYGGGAIGLMGAVSDAVLAHGGRVLGVIPEFLAEREVGHRQAEMIIVSDMHTRKRTMFEHADAFCILPGGVGTLEEFFEIVTWRQLSVHNKPMLVANWNGYWDHLIGLGKAVEGGGFGYGPMEELFTVVSSVDEILPTLIRELAELPPVCKPEHPDLSEI